MAKIKITIDDVEDGEIMVSVISDCDFPADTSKWSSAQQAAMAVHHNLGVSLQDLATMESSDHTLDCGINEFGECTCLAGGLGIK